MLTTTLLSKHAADNNSFATACSDEKYRLIAWQNTNTLKARKKSDFFLNLKGNGKSYYS